MIELLDDDGKVGAIFDRTAIVKSAYEAFRIENLIGSICTMVDTGWEVLEANVETTTLVLDKTKSNKKGAFVDLRTVDKNQKDKTLYKIVKDFSNIKFIRSIGFSKLPNSILGYDLPGFIITNFFEFDSLKKGKSAFRKGHDFVSSIHFRNFWEVNSKPYISHVYNGGGYNLFYMPYREMVIMNESTRVHKSVTLRNRAYHHKPGVCCGKRGEILDAHIFKSSMFFTNEGQSNPDLSNEKSYEILSFLNSIFTQFILNLYSGQHKQCGYLNILPIPSVNQFSVLPNILKILEIKRYWYSKDETALEYHHLLSEYVSHNSLKKGIFKLKEKLVADKQNYDLLVKSNDDFWVEVANVPNDSYSIFEDYKKKRPRENLRYDSIPINNWENALSHSHEILQALFGLAFGRWDISSILDTTKIPKFNDFFDPLPQKPIVSLNIGKTVEGHPVTIPENGILVDDGNNPKDILKFIRNCIRVLWKDNSDKIEEELCEIGQFESLEDFIRNYNGFFNYHFERYTKSRRMAPIYWPISTLSNSFTV